MDIWTYGLAGVVAFGGTWLVDLLLRRYTKVKLSSEGKFAISLVLAFAIGFVPTDLGNDLLNRIKDAAYIATGIAGFYQLLSRIVAKVGNGNPEPTPAQIPGQGQQV